MKKNRLLLDSMFKMTSIFAADDGGFTGDYLGESLVFFKLH